MKKYEEEIFCNNIRILRRRYQLKKPQMARLLHISVASLSKLEEGEIPPRLSAEVIFFIYQHFQIKPTDMFAPLDCSDEK